MHGVAQRCAACARGQEAQTRRPLAVQQLPLHVMQQRLHCSCTSPMLGCGEEPAERRGAAAPPELLRARPHADLCAPQTQMMPQIMHSTHGRSVAVLQLVRSQRITQTVWFVRPGSTTCTWGS